MLAIFLTLVYISWILRNLISLSSCPFWRLQPQNKRCQLIKAHMSSGEITGDHFQFLKYLVEKGGIFSNLVSQLSVLKSQDCNSK